jgi:hypothetical protein
MAPLTLIVGAGQIDRIVADTEDLLRQYRNDTGCYYLDYQPITSPNEIDPEDIAVTLLVNSQVGWRAFHSLMEYGHTLDLTQLPSKPLEQTSLENREQITTLISKMAQLPGFAASVATKVLHKKRPDLIPVLDNQAIFGAYMNPEWPEKSATSFSIKNPQLILNALNWIFFDITRPENNLVWEELRAIEPNRSRIQLFDSVWWMYFRKTQPVRKR